MYRRTQTGGVVGISLAAAVLFTVVLNVLLEWHLATILMLLILVACLILFHSLTIVIEGSELCCYFGPGLIRKRFRISEVVDVVPVRNKWYYGWGIRFTPCGWMFNLSGLDAVELTLRSGKRFRIGTDEPQRVVEEIKRARQ